MPKRPVSRHRTKRRPAARPTKSRLDALVEEALTDCYGDAEEASGLSTAIEEHLELPFQTTVLGVRVTVTRVDLTDDNHIVALCTRRRERQRVPILDLPLPSPRPRGAEWIEAYRHWARRGAA